MIPKFELLCALLCKEECTEQHPTRPKAAPPESGALDNLADLVFHTTTLKKEKNMPGYGILFSVQKNCSKTDDFFKA